MQQPGLARFLDRSLARLVLVAAPAGYGKTTLLAQWSSAPSKDKTFAWISLGPEDNDPIALWQLVVHALQRACPALSGEGLLRSLHDQYGDVTGIFLPALVNELAALPARVAILLDDYDLIQEPACHEQLEFLLLHLPPQAQIVLSSRADPPLQLARLRAAGDLAEIRMQQLLLTQEEAAAVIRTISGVELGEHDLRELVDRTEGWPAGVYLAALSLRGRPDPGDFVRKFSGGHRYIGDFLAEEVINQQPAHIRLFLLHTAILDRFTAPLSDAVTGTANAQEIIRTLESENLFLVPLDDRREWYRYHHLFAQALVTQLLRAEPDILPVLHRRASAWHQRWGSADEAIGHALAAADTGATAALIAEHWLAFVDTGRTETVRGWLRALGDDEIGAHPLAAHCAAWVAAICGERELVRRWLPVAQAGKHRGPLPDGMRSLQSSAALLDGTFGFRGLGKMRKSAAKAVHLEHDAASPWYALARASSGAALYFSGEFAAANRQLDQALLSKPQIARVRLLAACFQCLVALQNGRLGQAEALASMAHDIVADPGYGLRTAAEGSLAFLASGAVHAAHARLDEAHHDLEHGLRTRRRWPGISSWPTLEILLRLAPVLQDLGDIPGATALLGEARDVLTAFPDGAQTQFERLDRLQRQLERSGQAGLRGEPLTVREEAVLRLLPGRLSLREIGQELYVSANTVKSHTRSIYRKLGVSSRDDAINRGRERGIL